MGNMGVWPLPVSIWFMGSFHLFDSRLSSHGVTGLNVGQLFPE